MSNSEMPDPGGAADYPGQVGVLSDRPHPFVQMTLGTVGGRR